MNHRRRTPLLLAAVFTTSSACQLGEPGVGEESAPAVATSNLVINEFTPGSSGQVEIYNGTGADIDASGWQIDDIDGGGTRPKTLGSGSVVPAGGLLVVGYSGINYASADQVRLVDGQGTEVDAHDNFWTGSSNNGLCFGRQPDGGAWADVAIACTLGSSNGGGGGTTCDPVACDDGDPCTVDSCDAADQCAYDPAPDGTACGTGATCSAGVCAGVPALTINEFQPGSGGWVEVHNAGAVAVDLTGWMVDDVADGGTKPKAFASDTWVPAGGVVSLSYSGVNTASADQVRLVDGNGATVDEHSNFWDGSSIAGLCFGRMPDGGAWADTSIECSRDVSNGGGGGGGGQGLLLRGTLLAPGGAFDGELLILDHTIACAATSCASVPGASGATVVDTNGVILPGLIDVHNHVLYDIFDESDWTPAQVYTNHNQWPNEAHYKAMVDAKQYLNGEGGSPWDFGCEMDKYGELKGLIAGTTSIVGAAIPTNRGCYGSLARTIDQSPNDLGFDKVQTSALFPISTASADAVCNNITTGKTDAYVAHVAEGTDTVSLDEFAKLGTVTTIDECLYAPQTTIVHGTALQGPQFDIMAARSMSLVWSPRVNVFLYGGGTDLAGTSPNIPLARSKGVNVALGADWSVGGSINLLEELRFANQVDDQVWGDQLTSRDLVTMATANAAAALGLQDVLGSLTAGMEADIAVISGDRTHPYDAVLAARPADVKMTMVGGVLFYGDLPYESLAPSTPGCEHPDICGVQKFVCVAEDGGTSTNKFGQTYAEIRGALDGAMQAYDDLDLSAWNFAPIAPLVQCP